MSSICPALSSRRNEEAKNRNRVGSPAARDEASKVLTDARRSLYRLLADDEAVAAPEA